MTVSPTARLAAREHYTLNSGGSPERSRPSTSFTSSRHPDSSFASDVSTAGAGAASMDRGLTAPLS